MASLDRSPAATKPIVLVQYRPRGYQVPASTRRGALETNASEDSAFERSALAEGIGLEG